MIYYCITSSYHHQSSSSFFFFSPFLLLFFFYFLFIINLFIIIRLLHHILYFVHNIIEYTTQSNINKVFLSFNPVIISTRNSFRWISTNYLWNEWLLGELIAYIKTKICYKFQLASRRLLGEPRRVQQATDQARSV